VKTPQPIVGNNSEIVSINKQYIEEIEKLTQLLDNKSLAEDTKKEINETIRCYAKELRKFISYFPMEK